jgi:hypothetical protein
VRLVINSSVVGISVTSELSISTSSIAFTPGVLLELGWLWHVLVFALFILTAVLVASHISFLIETVSVPMLFGLVNWACSILESVRKI